MHFSLRALGGALLLCSAIGASAQVGSRSRPVTAPAAVPAPKTALPSNAKVASFTQNFDDITTLAGAGWVMTNASVAVGSTNWFQGSNVAAGGPFDAFNGAANGYIGANYNNTGNVGTISNWLMTPVLDFGNAATLTFYTRKASPDTYADRLEVRISTNGASTSVGTGTGVGDYTTLALSINPTLVLGVYPTAWTQYTLTHANGLPHNGTGRIAFRYFVTNAGLSGAASDYIGIDAVNFSAGAPEYQVGGNVSGLQGAGLTLTLNGGTPYPIAADGSFTFPGYVLNAASYTVAVQDDPSNPSQTCSVTNGSGTINGAVTDVQVTCVTDTFSVGGSVSGLAGSGLVLQNNGGDDLAIAADGTFTFPAGVTDGQTYAVTVLQDPSMLSQTCVVANGSGTIASAAVTNVAVTCTTDSFDVGGTVSGLAGSGLTVQLNGGTPVAIGQDGAFSVGTLADGTVYSVTVASQPTQLSQTCVATDDTGTVAGADVTDIAIVCTTDGFTIGGTVTGLEGSGLVLKNIGETLAIAADGSFEFPTPVTDGMDYVVTVLTDPSTPAQRCTVASGEGTVAGADVTDIAVTCVTEVFSVSGTVTGLVGTGLVLDLNGVESLGIAGSGAFTFKTEIEDLNGYSVTVETDPSLPAQTCSVSGGEGTIASADVTDVLVTCTTDPFALSILEGTPQSADIDTDFPLLLIVTVLDGDGAPVSGEEVSFDAPLSGASALLSDGDTSGAGVVTTTNDSGNAAVNATANGTPGCYGVTATVTAASNGVVFELTNVDPVPPAPEIYEDGFETSPAQAKGLFVCGQ